MTKNCEYYFLSLFILLSSYKTSAKEGREGGEESLDINFLQQYVQHNMYSVHICAS